MNKFFLLILLFLLPPCLSAKIFMTEHTKKFFSSKNFMDITQFSDSEYVTVAKELKQVISEERYWTWKKKFAYKCLIHAGDKEATDNLIKLYYDNSHWKNRIKARRVLVDARQLALIPKLADIMYKKEEPDDEHLGPEGEFIMNVISVDNAFLIRNILSKSSQVSEKLRQWADIHKLRGKSMYDRRKEMRVWWKQNKERFMRGEYDKLEPPVMEEDAPNPMLKMQTNAALPKSLPMPKPQSAVTTNSNLLPISKAKENKKTGWVYLFIPIFLVAGYAWRRKR